MRTAATTADGNGRNMNTAGVASASPAKTSIPSASRSDNQATSGGQAVFTLAEDQAIRESALEGARERSDGSDAGRPQGHSQDPLNEADDTANLIVQSQMFLHGERSEALPLAPPTLGAVDGDVLIGEAEGAAGTQEQVAWQGLSVGVRIVSGDAARAPQRHLPGQPVPLADNPQLGGSALHRDQVAAALRLPALDKQPGTEMVSLTDTSAALADAFQLESGEARPLLESTVLSKAVSRADLISGPGQSAFAMLSGAGSESIPGTASSKLAAAEPSWSQGAALNAVTEQKWSAAMNQQIRSMIDTGNLRADLQLTPPDLGELRIKIELHGQDTRVWLHLTQPDARAAIEQALPRLQELLDSGGLNLSEANVSQQDHQARGEQSAPTVLEAEDEEVANVRRVHIGLVDDYA